jgi:hypothetical protein
MRFRTTPLESASIPSYGNCCSKTVFILGKGLSYLLQISLEKVRMKAVSETYHPEQPLVESKLLGDRGNILVVTFGDHPLEKGDDDLDIGVLVLPRLADNGFLSCRFRLRFARGEGFLGRSRSFPFGLGRSS